MKKTVFIILFLSVIIGYSQGPTSPHHLPDIIIWENDTLQTQTTPLYQYKKLDIRNYLSKKGIRPKYWGDVKLHQAEWKIKDKNLYLSNIYSKDYENDNYKVNLDSLFSNYKDGLVLADWFTGNLFIPQGEYIRKSVSPGFRVYESEWKITIERGKIISKVFKTNNYYESIYTQKNDSLKKFIIQKIDWVNIPIIKGKEKIRIKFEIGNSKNNFKVSVETENDSIKKEFIRVAELLPEFSYYYRHGEIINMKYTLPITLSEEIRKK